MTRKDFELIAETVRNLEPGDGRALTREDIATAFAAKLAATNPRFKSYIFARACGVTTGIGK